MSMQCEYEPTRALSPENCIQSDHSTTWGLMQIRAKENAVRQPCRKLCTFLISQTQFLYPPISSRDYSSPKKLLANPYLLCRVKHPNVVELVQLFDNKEALYIVLEL